MRRRAALAAALLTLGLLSACHEQPAPAPVAQSPAITSPPPAATPSPTASVAPPAPPTTPLTTAPVPSAPPVPTVSYPKDAKGYCLAGVTAWAGHQTTRVNDLSTDAAAQMWGGLTPGLNNAWKVDGLEGASGSTYCTLTNATGDQLQVQVLNQTLGRPRAIADVMLTRAGQ
jgi:hypothetical protein